MRKPKETSLRFTDEQVRGILKGELRCLRFPATGDFYNMFTEAIRTCPQLLKPKYIVGDTIRVREAWAKIEDLYTYRATRGVMPITWRSSATMPRRATRAKLQITNIRSEPAGSAWNLCYDYKLILL